MKIIQAFCLLLNLIFFNVRAQEFSPYFDRSFLIISNYDTSVIISAIKRARDLKLLNIDSALSIADQSYSRSVHIRFGKGIIHALMLKAEVYEQIGDYSAALVYYRKALQEAKNVAPTQTYLPWILSNIGLVYNKIGDFNTAASNYHEALTEAERLLERLPVHHPDHKRLVATHIGLQNNMTKQLLEVGQSQQALAYLNKLEHSAIKMNNDYILGNILINKGYYYSQLSQWAVAEQLCAKALKISREKNIAELELLSLLDLGIINLRKHDYHLARSYFVRAYRLDHPVTAPVHRNGVLLGLGEAYMGLREYNQARPILQKAASQAEKLNLKSNLLQIYGALAALSRASGDYKAALDYTETYTQIKDSIKSKEVIHSLNSLEFKYRTVEKDKELKAKELKIEQQHKNIEKRNFIVALSISGILILLILLISIYLSFRQRRRNQFNEIKILKQEKQFLNQEKELERMKALLEGEEKERVRIARDIHDGVAGQLAAIRMNFNLIQRDHRPLSTSPMYKAAILQLDDAAAELRKTAHNLMPEILLRKGLSEALHVFCRKQEKLGVIEIDFQCLNPIQRFSPEFEIAIYRMTQELVFNAIKHAKASIILVQLNQFNKLLSITIEDNGVGADLKVISERPGMGLKTVIARTQAMKGHIDIKSADKGTSIYLEFNLTVLTNNDRTSTPVGKA